MRTFAQLFAGRTDCFGVYRITDERSDGKQKGRGITYPNTNYPDRNLAPDDWEKHLSGKQMLGIVPVLPDGQCSWFAIDVDDYTISHQEIVINIEKNELPLVTCRSKSGGAHLYCFIDGLIEASLAQELAKKWVIQLELKTCEIFPKQANFSNDKAKGNWIILPYFKSDKSVDFGIDLDGQRILLEDFEKWCYAKEISPDEAKAYISKKEIKPDELNKDQILAQSPPCINAMLKEGVSEGGRNNAGYHFAVYYRELYRKGAGDEDWGKGLTALNDENTGIFHPPMHTEEVSTINRNVKNMESRYYSCEQAPMCDHCDKMVCRKLKFGIGPDKSFYGDVEISSILKIDSRPPVWVLKTNGVNIEMDTETLLSPRKFRNSVAESINLLVERNSEKKHDELIGPLMKTALQIEPIEELTISGKTSIVFQEWTKNLIAKSTDIKDLVKGLPYYDEGDKTIYFRGADFLSEWKRVYKDNTTERSIWSAARLIGFNRKQRRIDVKNEWIWYYPILADEEVWFKSEIEQDF